MGRKFKSRLTLIYAYSNDNIDINARGEMQDIFILHKQARIFHFETRE